MKGFFDFFPTPKFLEMPAPGLALTDTDIKFLEFGSGPEGLMVKRYGAASLPAGLIENGVIKDQESLVHALQNFRKSFGLRYIRTTLPEERSYLFQTKVPRVSDKELRTAVESTIEENVPLSVSEAVFDYVTLPASPVSGPQEDVSVSVSVISEAVVLEYLSVFREAGFMPLHFDVESQAVAKALVPWGDQGVFLIMNIEAARVGLYIVSNGAVSFTSTVPASFPPEPKNKAGEGAQVLEAVTSALKPLEAEIKKVFLYWQTQADRHGEKVEPISHVLLCGGQAGREGVEAYLSHALPGITVELGNVWENAFSLNHYVPAISRRESLGYASAAGLALQKSSN